MGLLTTLGAEVSYQSPLGGRVPFRNCRFDSPQLGIECLFVSWPATLLSSTLVRNFYTQDLSATHRQYPEKLEAEVGDIKSSIGAKRDA